MGVVYLHECGALDKETGDGGRGKAPPLPVSLPRNPPHGRGFRRNSTEAGRPRNPV